MTAEELIDCNTSYYNNKYNPRETSYPIPHYCEKTANPTPYTLEDRIDWTEYGLIMAFVVSLRSEDLFVKHGAVIQDIETKNIIGTGYNGAIRGATKNTYVDSPNSIDMADRDGRRQYMIHAEINALNNCIINPLYRPAGAIAYITGYPCLYCLQNLVSNNVKKIVFADRMGSITEDAEYKKAFDKVVNMSKVEIQVISMKNKWLKECPYIPFVDKVKGGA